ncbi:uncharacterized protein RCH25_018351 [Pelodytes ibericus]
MSFSRWIYSFFQPQRPTLSCLHLLNESKPLRDLRTSNSVELVGTRAIREEEVEEAFQRVVSRLGGKNNILLVGEAGYSPENDGGSSGILPKLSHALFPDKDPSWDMDEVEGGDTGGSCLKSQATSKSRTLQFPVILVIFREALIADPANAPLIREVLRDVKLRVKGSTPVLVGIIYSREPLGEKNMVSQIHLELLMGQVFEELAWGICSYSRSQPETILDVKRTIKDTVETKTRGQCIQSITDNTASELQMSFKKLVHRLGGKERFLLVGNLCPSPRPSERAVLFKELSRALFEEDLEYPPVNGGHRNGMFKTSGDCTQLPKPRSFPYPLILVAFRYTFLRDDANRTQVKEILADVRVRAKRCCTQVIGVICNPEDLEAEERQGCKALLLKNLRQTFGGSVGVCFYVRSKPETVEEVKRCICDVMKETQ